MIRNMDHLVDEAEELNSNTLNFFSNENGTNLFPDLLKKIDFRCRLEFEIHKNINGNHEILIINGDHNFQTIYGYQEFYGLSLQHLFGPATSHETLQELYSHLFLNESCEYYLNLYTASGNMIL